MCRIMPLLLVVLLLSVDWVFDPHHGACAHSSRYSSQPCLLVRLGRNHWQGRLDRDFFNTAPLALNVFSFVQQAAWLQLPQEAAAYCEAGLIYLFMTIQL
jgi:hypothetical protein